jgi:DNA segregation ATPase FtsK/SpoIIIE, S-DNA-T family
VSIQTIIFLSAAVDAVQFFYTVNAEHLHDAVKKKICLVGRVSTPYNSKMSTAQSKKSPREESKIQLVLRDLAGLVLIFLAAFSTLALLSYSVHDPSWFTASSRAAKNLGGMVGSYWSALLLQVFGAASFVFALSLLLAGVALFRKISSKEFSLATANYLVLIFTSAASLGLTHQSLHLGEATIPMGGIIGVELGGFLRRYLNTAGAALLTFSLFSFALSLSLQMSLRDLALHCWLAISKTGVFVGSFLIYIGLQVAGVAKLVVESLTPACNKFFASIGNFLGNKLNSIWDKRFDLLKGQSGTAETANDLPPIISAKIKTPNLQLVPTPSEVAAVEDAGPEIVPRGSTQESNFQPTADAIPELAPVEGTDFAAPLFSFMKKAVRENERVVKEALGKKIKFEFPPLSFLRAPTGGEVQIDSSELRQNSAMLREKLADFKIDGAITAVKPGPVVTMYEFKPGPGVKVNSIAQVADDLALALSAESVRIVAPIPGRDVVGMEVPNRHRERVLLQEIIGSNAFKDRNLQIPIAIGKDILGNPYAADLRKMPHMLVAGATGSGKSVFINALICSLLYRFSPDDLKMILVDPKQLELNLYENIPHLLLPVVTEPKKASLALRWAVEEMERRYRLIANVGMRDADGFNQKLAGIGQAKIMELLQKSGDPSLADAANCENMPKLIIIIDELADLMMTSKSDVETNICRLAQKARAAGIHLVLATQRPSVDVVTGLIKANLPARISFRLSSKNDSRTIFDSMGAERLVGSGDMLMMPPGESRLVRMHGAYIGEEEIEQITKFWRDQAKPVYREDILVDEEEDGWDGEASMNNDDDPRFQQAMDIAMNQGFISASLLQRRMGIGYPKAARFVEIMEARGVVGPAQGSKPRPVIANRT